MAVSVAALETTWQNERRQYVRCRTIGHSWHDYDSNWDTKLGVPLTLRCERCGTERRDVIGSYGQLVTRSYFKPDNYDLGREDYKPSRDDFRLMLLAIRGEGDTKRKRAAS